MEVEKKLTGEATPEQIAEWKAKYKKVWQINVDGERTCYLRKPTRQEISIAWMLGLKNPLAENESILNSCWLGGDEAIRTDDDLFLSVSRNMPEMIEAREVEVKNL